MSRRTIAILSCVPALMETLPLGAIGQKQLGTGSGKVHTALGGCRREYDFACNSSETVPSGQV